MSEYVDFHYMPLEGKITGKQVLKQTEDAINDIGEKVYSLDIDSSLIDEAIETSKKLIGKEGILCGISSGTNVAAALRMAKKLGKGKTVVTVLPDTGERYFSTELFEF